MSLYYFPRQKLFPMHFAINFLGLFNYKVHLKNKSFINFIINCH